MWVRAVGARSRSLSTWTRELTLITTSSGSVMTWRSETPGTWDATREHAEHARMLLVMDARSPRTTAWRSCFPSAVLSREIRDDNRNCDFASRCLMMEISWRYRSPRATVLLEILRWRVRRFVVGVSEARHILQLWTLELVARRSYFSSAASLPLTLISPARSARWCKNPFYQHESLRELTVRSELKNA